MIGQKGIPTRFGGIERHVEGLSRKLGAEGHDVVVYTRAWYALPTDRFAPGVRTVATPTIRTKHLDAIVHTFTSTIHAVLSRPDIIHYHGVGPSLLSWIPRIIAPRIRVVTTFHCIDRTQRKWGAVARFALGLGERTACLFAHRTIAVSQALRSYCATRYGREVVHVPNGIYTPKPQHSTNVLKRFGLEKGRYVLMVSRLLPDKGAHYLIKAFVGLQRRGLTRGMRLVIAGDSSFTDGYVRRVKAMAAGNEDIIFTGFQEGDALAQLYAGAFMTALPSETEGMPLVVLEAMSHGKAVLGSDIPAIAEIVGPHGLTFRNRSVLGLTRTLRFALANPEIIRKKGETGRAHVLAEYHWDAVAPRVETIYEELMKRRESAVVPRTV